MSLRHNSEESNISKYKNLDVELEKAIEYANNIYRNLGESILVVYNMARGKGFTPEESRTLVEKRILNASPSYVRRILPDEAKHKEKVRPLRHKVSQIIENIVTISLDTNECREIKQGSIINGRKFKYDLNNKKVVKWI